MPFPLPIMPKQTWHKPPRSFGARRDKGRRKHAGCDLYAPAGTPVHAVADGKVLKSGPFYLGTHALEVDHASCIIRYGEIEEKLAPGVKKGARVKAGQRLGAIGRLDGLNVTMLHLEMYSGAAKGPLTQASNPPFYRRADLLDPAKALDDWAREPLPGSSVTPPRARSAPAGSR